LGADGYVLKHLPREKIIQRLSEVFDSIEEATDGEISDEGSGSTPAV
jgi:DNA-binding NarL/FixJ family response regulator